MDLRERIVSACQSGASQASVARRFGVCAKTVERLVARAATGELAPRPKSGRPRRLSASQSESLGAMLEEQVNWTLDQLCAQWQERTGQSLPRSTMHDQLRALGARYKKNARSRRAVPAQARPVSPANRVS